MRPDTAVVRIAKTTLAASIVLKLVVFFCCIFGAAADTAIARTALLWRRPRRRIGFATVDRNAFPSFIGRDSRHGSSFLGFHGHHGRQVRIVGVCHASTCRLRRMKPVQSILVVLFLLSDIVLQLQHFPHGIGNQRTALFSLDRRLSRLLCPGRRRENQSNGIIRRRRWRW